MMMFFEQSLMAPLQLGVLVAQALQTLLEPLPLPAQAPTAEGARQAAGNQEEEGEQKAHCGGPCHQPALRHLVGVALHSDLGALLIVYDDEAQGHDRCHGEQPNEK
jgi:hypothetical protein